MWHKTIKKHMDDIKKIDLLYDMACTIKRVIEENDMLREENRRLREIEKEYREFVSNQVKTYNENFANVITTLLKVK